MTPEQILAIAASQWTEIPTPSQIIKALQAGGFKIVSGAPDLPEIAPEQIKEEREKLGWSQTTLAIRAGTTQQHVHRIETLAVKNSRYVGQITRALAQEIAAQGAANQGSQQ